MRTNWHFLSTQRSTYLTALWDVLRGTWGSANFFVGALGIFPKAVHFAREMQRQNITHVHACFANHAAVAALIIHRLTGLPYSFTARGSDVNVDRTMLQQKLKESDFAIAVSSFIKEVMVEVCDSHIADKIHVVFGGIDTDRFRPTKSGSGTHRFRILCVATLEEVKGHQYLVEACRLLQARSVDFECIFLGDGPLRRTLGRQITRGNLNDKIVLRGACPQAEVIEELGRADVLVLASTPTPSGRQEGLPTVLQEAMACALPVVATDIAGIPELVEHDRSGLLVSPGNPSALADALQRLASASTVRQQMGRAGRERVLEQCDLRANTARLAELFAHDVPPGLRHKPTS